MKIKITILLTWFVLTSGITQDTLFVNPGFQPNGVTTFATLQEAIDAASSSDVLYVYPGGYSGVTTVNKTLHLIGRGYEIAENYPNTYVNNASVYQLDINSNGANSIVEGITVRNLRIQAADNCLISRNKIETAIIYDCSNVVLSSNYIGNSNITNPTSNIPGCTTSTSRATIITSGVGNLLIINNIIRRSTNEIWTWRDSQCGDFGYSSHVVFRSNYTDGRVIFPLTSFVAEDNQLKYANDLSLYVPYGLIRRNVWVSRSLPSNNLQLSSLDFIAQFGNSTSFDGQYQLLPNAPSKGYASDGGDVGPFGGPMPYKLSGVTALPFIYQLQVPDAVPAGNGVQVTVKVKTEN